MVARRKLLNLTVSTPLSVPSTAGFAEDLPEYKAALSLEAILQREYRNSIDKTGADVAILDELAAHGFNHEELFELVVPRRTFARRLKAGARLSPEETDRAVRLARVTAHAERVFGDRTKAHRWMRKPSPMLDGATPLVLLKTETGAQLVEQTLHRIDYGMFA
jgi:putative toxin-antitoxin system antitoxin component (TIGR02293 family)